MTSASVAVGYIEFLDVFTAKTCVTNHTRSPIFSRGELKYIYTRAPIGKFTFSMQVSMKIFPAETIF